PINRSIRFPINPSTRRFRRSAIPSRMTLRTISPSAIPIRIRGTRPASEPRRSAEDGTRLYPPGRRILHLPLQPQCSAAAQGGSNEQGPRPEAGPEEEGGENPEG